jgi:hypothetical protein
MRNLFTKSALVAALVTLVPAAALASTARVQSMGLQGDFIQDYTNVYAYPSSIVRYQNLVYGDLGNKDVTGGDLNDFEDNGDNVPGLQNSGRAMGAYLNTWKWLPGTWGIQINENHNTISQAYGAGYYDRNRNSGITLLWGDKVGGANIGLMVEKASSSLNNGTDISEPYTFDFPAYTAGGTNARQIMNSINAGLGLEDRNSWGVGAGVTLNWSAWEREHQADFAVHYRDNSLNVEDVAGGATLEDNGNTSFSVNARAQLAISDNSYLTPVVNYYSIGRGTKFTDSAAPANNSDFDNSVTGWQIGLAESWVLRESDLLVMGVSLGHESIDYEDPTILGDPFEVSYETTPSIFGALEVHPVGWWHVRMGAGKPVWSKLEITDHDPAGDVVTTRKDSPLQYAFGTGFRLGNRLDLDAVVNQDFSFTGSWGASGNSETPFSSLSMTYRF